MLWFRQVAFFLLHTIKCPKVDSNGSDRFAVVATTRYILQMHQDANPWRHDRLYHGQQMYGSIGACGTRVNQWLKKNKLPTLSGYHFHKLYFNEFLFVSFCCLSQTKNMKTYPPSSLNHQCRGLMWSLNFEDRLYVNFFVNPLFAQFRSTLDAIIKELQASGQYAMHKAEIITSNNEVNMWTEGVHRDHSLQALLDTLMFYIEMYYAHHGGKNPCWLHLHPS